MQVRRVRTEDLSRDEIEAIRTILWAAFADDGEGGFTEDDWQHALGGVHVIAEVDGRVAAHGSVVPREIRFGGQALRTGYVEAVATQPGLQRMGLGTVVMREVGAIIDEAYEVGVLGTGEHGFYERLGWRTWRGPSSVRASDGDRATPDDDGYLMVLEVPATRTLDLDAPINCDLRPGDVW